MMNVFAIYLVLTTLVTAGVFSPYPEKKEDVIVKEGHRVVVVEYDPNDGNTKVSISPLETEQKTKTGHTEEAKDEIKENGGYRPSARELVCDAFGKCKHRIASALERTEDSISEKAHDAAEKIHEIEEGAKEAFEKVKDTVAGKAHEAAENASEVKEKTKDFVREKVKGKAKDVADIAKTLKGDVKGNASDHLEIIKEKAKEAKCAVEEHAHSLKEEGKREYPGIQKFFSDVSAYILSAKNFRSLMGIIHLMGFANFRSLMGIIHLMGFALSYGVCVWITFISSNTLAKALAKQQFAMVQSKIYPLYFKTMSCGIFTAFLGHFLSQSHRYYVNRTERIQGLIFLASFSVTMFNSFYLEPRARKSVMEGMKLEKEEGRGKDVFNVEPRTSCLDAAKDLTDKPTGEPLSLEPGFGSLLHLVRPKFERWSQKLKKPNFISSYLNGFTLVALTYHLVYISQLLHSCTF